jgi:hypothetical protein
VPSANRDVFCTVLKNITFAIASCLALLTTIQAGTLHVGPDRAMRSIQDAAPLLQPGDVLEVDGGALYEGMVVFRGNGTAAQPIIVKGIAVNGVRPRIAGTGGVPHGAVVKFMGAHYVFEGFDVSAAGDPTATRVIYNVADDVTIRDTVVHDGNCTGIHGSDSSGSLTLDHVEVHRCGGHGGAHQIYVATDNTRFPRAKFRMQFCYVHDGAGGNNVKSRAGRNEIYYNWIEGAAFHELDLIGADVKAQRPGTADAVREDSDIVGNVLLKRRSSKGFVARLGTDGAGTSQGRYRFVNNTIIIDPSVPGVPALIKVQPVLKMLGSVESVEMHNNVIDHGGRPVRVFLAEKPDASAAFAVAGSHNWLPQGSTGIPDAWTGTIFGKDPGFRDAGECDFRPRDGSPLLKAANPTMHGPGGFEFPAPLARPAFEPPVKTAAPQPHPRRDAASIGAF